MTNQQQQINRLKAELEKPDLPQDQRTQLLLSLTEMIKTVKRKRKKDGKRVKSSPLLEQGAGNRWQ